MSTSRRWVFVASLSALVGAGVALTVRHVVRADGIPAVTPLLYRGYLEDSGAAVDGARSIGASLHSALVDGMEYCAVAPRSLMVTAGRFEVPLDECVAAVRANRDPWLQITVGTISLPRTKLGAVPYAIEAERAQSANSAVGPLLARIAALEARTAAAEARTSDDCPPGWTRNATEIGFRDDGLRRLCHKRLADGTVDEVVRVGTPPSVFWIDRYEASVTNAAAPYARAFESEPEAAFLPRNGAWRVETSARLDPLTTPYLARSVTSVAPARWVTWFQAMELCRMSGKRLPTGEEWLTAALGTYDEGDHDGSRDDRCNTGNGSGGPSPAAPRITGGGTGCRSHWGAQDMVGNLWEWTTEWYAGNGATSQVNSGVQNWPTGYNSDGTWNIEGAVDRGGSLGIGIPSAAFRGGSWHDGTRAGVYSLFLADGPSGWNHHVGFRCVLRR